MIRFAIFCQLFERIRIKTLLKSEILSNWYAYFRNKSYQLGNEYCTILLPFSHYGGKRDNWYLPYYKYTLLAFSSVIAVKTIFYSPKFGQNRRYIFTQCFLRRISQTQLLIEQIQFLEWIIFWKIFRFLAIFYGRLFFNKLVMNFLRNFFNTVFLHFLTHIF